MAISADLKRVFEIGPVFRAENSNTHRHLCEYTGLNIKMIIENDYHEVIRVIDGILKAIFETVYQTMTADLTAIRERWPSDEMTYLPETLILEHSEGF
jgi:aspartyl-tRNA synthetase